MQNNIKKLRTGAGLSQEALANKVGGGTTRATIMKLEKGDMALTTDWMEKIARALLLSSPCQIIEENYTPNDKAELRDSEVAIVDALKDLIQLMTIANPDTHAMLQNAFSYQRVAYEEKDLPAAALVMRMLGRFVGEPADSPESESRVISRLLHMSPLGSA